MMEGDDYELFRRSLSHVLQTTARVDVDAALREVGWDDALEADPAVAVRALFELQGAAAAASSALSRVAGAEPVVMPVLGSSDPPGTLDGPGIRVSGIATSAAGRAVVVARRDGKHVFTTVDLGELVTRPVAGIDPWLGLVEVEGDVGATDLAPFDWPAAVRLAHLALGHEIVGASRRMLELAREHAVQRVQFGRPIAAFQAVRHRLADTLIAIETAGAMLTAAWDDGSALSASMAKAVAGRAGRTTARHCQQVLAGIGFTTEHPLHRYVRRVLVLDELFGSARALTKALGEELVRTRRLPPMLPL